jgi:hypothetical protein
MKKILAIVLMALFVMAGCEEQVTDAPPSAPSPMKYGPASASFPTFDPSTLATDVPGDFQVDGTLTATGGVVGDITGNASTASNLSGTPALPDGTTATTQSASDNSTKLATTAYVDGTYSDLDALTNDDDIKLSTTTDGHEFSLGVYDTNGTTWRYIDIENGDSSQASATDWPRIAIPSGIALTGIDDIRTRGGLTVGTILAVTPQSLEVTTEADITLTSSLLLLTGDNDADNDAIDLQDGTITGQQLTIIGVALIDGDDTITVNMADTTCTGCLTVLLDEIGDTWGLVWTGTTWATVSNSEVP